MQIKKTTDEQETRGNRGHCQPGKNILAAGLLCLLGLIVFSRSFGSELVFDSVVIIRDDSRLQAFSLKNLELIFSQDYWWPTIGSDLYRPFVTLSFFIERTILGYGVNPAPYQITNLLLHLAVGAGGLSLLRRLGLKSGWAWAASAWFVIHPYTAEIVPNIVGRSDIFALAAMLGCFALYLHARSTPSVPTHKTVALWGMILIFGCLSKENTISILAVMVWHRLTLGRIDASSTSDFKKLLDFKAKALIGVFIFAALGVIITPKLAFRERAGDKMAIAGDNALVTQSFTESRINATAILGQNLVNTIIPYQVSADYSYSQLPMLEWPVDEPADYQQITWAILTVFFVGIAVLLLPRKSPALAFYIGSALLVLAPTANIFVQIGTIRADRLVYPGIWFMAGAVAWVLQNLLARIEKHGKTLPVLIIGTATVAIVSVATYTHFRAVDWRTNKQFWAAMQATAPDSYKAMLGYGSNLVKQDDYELAKTGLEYVEAGFKKITDVPWTPSQGASVLARQTAGSCWLLFATMAKEKGEINDLRLALSKSETHLREALSKIDEMNAPRLKSPDQKEYANLARGDVIAIALSKALRAQNKAAEAVDVLKGSFRINKLNAGYLEALGFSCIESGATEEGEAYLFQALVLNDTNRELSRVLNTWMRTRAVPEQKAPLAKQDANSEENLAPPLDIEDPSVREKLRAAALKVDGYLKEENRPLEAARLQRALRLMLYREWNAPDTSNLSIISP